MKNFFTLFITTIFFNFALTQDVILSVNGSDLLYESTSDISGIQFNHDGCASSASGGDAASNEIDISEVSEKWKYNSSAIMVVC